MHTTGKKRIHPVREKARTGEKTQTWSTSDCGSGGDSAGGSRRCGDRCCWRDTDARHWYWHACLLLKLLLTGDEEQKLQDLRLLHLLRSEISCMSRIARSKRGQNLWR